MMVGRDKPGFAVLHVHVLALDLLADEVDDGLDGDAAGDLAGVVAAHAIGQYQQTDVGIERNGVLVVLADFAGVGQSNETQLAFQAHAAS